MSKLYTNTTAEATDGTEVAVSLALIVALYRQRQSAHVKDLTRMKQ